MRQEGSTENALFMRSAKESSLAGVELVKVADMVELDEERGWIRDSRQGDHAAFAALVRLHQQMIHAVTFRMTGSEADAEDLAQETFIQAFRQLHYFRGDSKFSSWLYRIAVNLCLNWKRRQGRQERLQAAWLSEQVAWGAGGPPPPASLRRRRPGAGSADAVETKNARRGGADDL